MEINNSVRVEKSMMSAGNCSDTGYVQVGLDMILLCDRSMLMAGCFLQGIIP